MKIQHGFSFCIAMGVLACSYALAQDPVGMIVSIEGRADAVSANGQQRALKIKSDVFQGDNITCHADSRLQIQFKDDSVLSLGPNSKMTIDEYVYNPANTETMNSSLKFTRGLFRVVTGKITELNPSRFSVRTSMATVGIRGCEVGFDLRQGEEDIFILLLPEGHRVLVGPHGISLPETITPRDLEQLGLMNVDKGGIAVLLRANQPMQRRNITPRDMQRFRALSAGRPDERQRRPQQDRNRSSLDQSTEDLIAMAFSTEDVHEVEQAFQEAGKSDPTDAPPPSQPETGILVFGEESTGGTRDRPDLTSRPEDEYITPEDGPDPDASPDDPPPDDPPPPPPPPANLIASGGGDGHDWVWGIWDDDTVDIAPYGPSAEYVSAADFNAIQAAATVYSLAGNGTAGSLLFHGGSTFLLEGACYIAVEIGNASDTWDGSFSLSDLHGNSLSFDTTGTLSAGLHYAEMNGHVTYYALDVGGTLFSIPDILTEYVHGYLIGPGVAPDPVTAAVGEYQFDHGAGTYVHGVFGTALAPY